MIQKLPPDLVSYLLSFLPGSDRASYSQTSKEAAKQIKDHHVWIESAMSKLGELSRDFLEPSKHDLGTHSVFKNKKIAQLMIDYVIDETLTCHQMCKAVVFKRVMDAFDPQIFTLFGGVNGYFQLPKVDPKKRFPCTICACLEGNPLLPSDLMDSSGKRFAIMRLDLGDGSKLIVFNTKNEIEPECVSYRVHTIGVSRFSYHSDMFKKRICDWDTIVLADLGTEIRGFTGRDFSSTHSSMSGMPEYMLIQIQSRLKKCAVYSEL